MVFITTTQLVRDRCARATCCSIPRGAGSGFVWDSDGHVVTNNHVVQGAAEAKVRLNDGRDYSAKPGRREPGARHRGAAHPRAGAAARGAADRHLERDLKVGQKVFAIGNPFGLDWSLTTGVVSALDRSLPAEDGRTIIEHLIQTDAAINPGNSGGPLLDSSGRLIGINTAIFSPSGAYAGVGFAVPVDTVNRVVPQLIAKGKYTRPVLGIATDEQLNQLDRQARSA